MGGFGSKPKDKTKHPEVGAGGDITEEEVAKALTTTSYDPRFPNQNQTRRTNGTIRETEEYLPEEYD